MPRAQLLYFYSEDCPGCVIVKPLALEIANKHRVFLKEVDATEEIELAQKYNINILPSLAYKGMVICGMCTKEDIELMFS